MAAEAGWLVGRLAEGQRKRLRAAALSPTRAQWQSNAILQAALAAELRSCSSQQALLVQHEGGKRLLAGAATTVVCI